MDSLIPNGQEFCLAYKPCSLLVTRNSIPASSSPRGITRCAGLAISRIILFCSWSGREANSSMTLIRCRPRDAGEGSGHAIKG
jgi:hypothetical protein